ncbi:hypothetical protein QJQ45_025195 [Haematococcus lacustris]|nr:hypothetical protein QJQ45_025195 [Haematococcus lacustris]
MLPAQKDHERTERAVLASLLLGFLVRGLFAIHVADPLGLHDQPVETDILVSQAAIPDLSCRNLFILVLHEGVAFFYGVKLDGSGRGRLFKSVPLVAIAFLFLTWLLRLLNSVSSLFESVTSFKAATALKPEAGAPPLKRFKTDRPFEAPFRSGRLMKEVDLTQALKGRQAELFWPDDAKWYLVEIQSVNLKTRQAKIVYASGEFEDVDLEEIMPPKRNRKRPVSPAPSAAGASGSGQQVQGHGQGQAVEVVIAERRQVIKAALRGLVEAALPDLSPAEVDAVVAEVNKRMTMGSKQCVLAAALCLSVLLTSFLESASARCAEQDGRHSSDRGRVCGLVTRSL